MMLPARQGLRPGTKRHFALSGNPFADDALHGADGMFMSANIREVRDRLYQTAKYGGWLAIVGESGAGKTTLYDDLIDRIHQQGDKIVIIAPSMIGMKESAGQGNTLKAGHISEALFYSLRQSAESLRRDPEARARQIRALLIESARAKNRHVLIIEEAHTLSINTLCQLKRFVELKAGHQRLLSVVLMGQPSLADTLSEKDPAVREVVQRCEVIGLAPLDDELAAFLAFKFKRVNKDLTTVLDETAIPALRQRLSHLNQKGKVTHSLLYPLAIGNLLVGAMNLAAELGVPLVNGQIIHAVKGHAT